MFGEEVPDPGSTRVDPLSIPEIAPCQKSLVTRVLQCPYPARFCMCWGLTLHIAVIAWVLGTIQSFIPCPDKTFCFDTLT